MITPRSAVCHAAWLLGLLVLFFVISNRPAAQEQDQSLYRVPGSPLAPDFTLTDYEGDTHTLSAYRGKVVVVNFWATWCPPCREEMPAMQRAWEQLKNEDILFLAINVGENQDTIFEFTATYPVGFPLLMDRDSSVIQAWPVRGLPTTFVVDTQGRMVYRAIGTRDWDSPAMLETVRALK